MASSELRNRANWQTISGFRALAAEAKFKTALQAALDAAYPSQFKIEKPHEFGDVYSTYILSNDVLDKIFNVDVTELRRNGKPKYSWGISMDFVIRNLKSKKSLFGEIKRQDGWIETTKPSDGRGNVHERCCKYFTPGLLKTIREASGVSDEILPFWVIFVGDITRDPKRNREIAFWFQEYKKNFYMWRNTEDIGDMLDFFENNLLPYLM